jgi:5-methyltetrahydrofolate--homocysteine methyltransferase
MPIDFDANRWSKIKEDYFRWWKGELKRPIIHITLTGCKPGREEPEYPLKGFTSFYGKEVSAEKIIDSWDYALSSQKFIGDGFPSIWPNFGPGVAASFLGAELKNGYDTVWFHPREESEIKELKFEYDPKNVWLNRIKEISKAAIQRWQGLVQVGMTDLGGNLDILSAFRPGEKLLLDLYDNPEDVKRLTLELHEFWWKYFDEINAVLRPVNPGYTAWTPIFSESPYYMLQCDFCYMIGPDMFDEFVKPELEATCKKLVNPFYHLDGIGQLPHLDSLLTIKELKGVQWVPGTGKPQCDSWPEIYRKIHKAGKLIQIWGDMTTLDTLVEQIGTAEGIIIFTSCDVSKKNEALEFLKKYKAI